MLQLSHASNGLNPRAEPWSHLGYLHRPATEDEIKGITHWVVTDLDTEVGCLSANFSGATTDRQECLPAL